MARIVYGAIVESIRGSIGGTTFQKNAYGYSVKNKANMVKPNSIAQNNRKLLLSKAVSDWRELTIAQQSDWNTWASTYKQYSKHNASSELSGYAVYVRRRFLQFLQYGLGVTLMTNPVYMTHVLDTVTIAITKVGAVLSLVLTWVTETEEWDVLYYISRPFTESQNYIGTTPRYIIASSNASASINISAQYLSVFGALPVVGQIVNVQVQLAGASDGLIVARSSQRITVT